jgi:hypothetical protein
MAKNELKNDLEKLPPPIQPGKSSSKDRSSSRGEKILPQIRRTVTNARKLCLSLKKLIRLLWQSIAEQCHEVYVAVGGSISQAFLTTSRLIHASRQKLQGIYVVMRKRTIFFSHNCRKSLCHYKAAGYFFRPKNLCRAKRADPSIPAKVARQLCCDEKTDDIFFPQLPKSLCHYKAAGYLFRPKNLCRAKEADPRIPATIAEHLHCGEKTDHSFFAQLPKSLCHYKAASYLFKSKNLCRAKKADPSIPAKVARQLCCDEKTDDSFFPQLPKSLCHYKAASYLFKSKNLCRAKKADPSIPAKVARQLCCDEENGR